MKPNTATRRPAEVIETPTRGELVVLPLAGRRLTVLEQFDESWTPEPYTGCWIWFRSRSDRYGTIKVNGHVVGAHRVSWTLYRGEIPKGMCVLHSCDTPTCVNPDHLFLGTKKDNTADCIRKGRFKFTRPENRFGYGSAQL